MTVTIEYHDVMISERARWVERRLLGRIMNWHDLSVNPEGTAAEAAGI